MQPINLHDKFALFNDHWSPRIVGALNGQHVKLAKLKGPFVWHAHENEDELFLVIKGTLHMEFRDRTEIIREQECIIVSRGVEHRPVAPEEVWVLLFEPETTVNTGNVAEARTRHQLDWI